jgi:sortase A
MNKVWALLVIMGSVLLGSGGYIHVKAIAAQWMLERAWQNTLEQHLLSDSSPQKPWPWADTWPVAKLKLGTSNEMIVLDGVSGNALAFGPGRIHGVGRVESGLVVMAGHRDTHFSSLKELTLGDEISIQSEAGAWTAYQVSDISIVDTGTHMIDMSARDSGQAQLMLVTCYPFDAVQAGGPMRYVVTAEVI